MHQKFVFGAVLACWAVVIGVLIFAPTSPSQVAQAVGIGDIPGIHQDVASIPTAAADLAQEWAVWRAPFNCRIKGLSVVPDAAVTGAATNNFALNFRDKGSAGTGTTNLATTITFASGTNLVAYDEQAFTLSTTDATISLDAGDVVSVNRTVNGSGLLSPRMVVVIRYEPR